MAISTQDIVKAKRRANNYLGNFGKPFATGVFRWFFSFLAQFTAGVDMQVKEFATLTNTDVIIADAACKIYGILLVKATATATWFKAGDSATTCPTDGSGVLGVKVTNIGEATLLWGQGLPMASGFTLQCSTTGTGSTGSGANGVKGFVLLSAP